MKEIFKTLFTAIIGGIAVYYIPTWIKAWWSKYHPILTYNFADNDSGLRRVHHSFGVCVKDKDASCGEAWEHTSTRINPGHTTCYGPYTKEISFRGRYKAIFRIKAIGIKDSTAPIVVLDITHGERQDNGQFVILGLPLAEKEIQTNELVDEKYKEFDVGFDYDGQSLLEFRCAVTNPEGGYKKNIDKILFDNVKVFRGAELI